MKNGPVIAAGVVIAGALAGAAQQVAWATRVDFVKAVHLSSARVLPQLSPAARALLIAHGAFESGFGQGRAARAGWNIFNITAGSAWTGDKWTDVDGDTDGAGNRITQVWRKYPGLDAALDDYWAFLGPTQNRGRYVVARQALERGDLPVFVRELSRAGYFTLDANTYAARLQGVLLTVKGYL